MYNAFSVIWTFIAGYVTEVNSLGFGKYKIG